ncbi:MAG TPA: RNA-binding protein [Ktedonobacterales bacterium]|jgi:RNA recognition motif-containing protein
MTMRIYVGNLPYTTTDQSLADLFAPYGEVTDATVLIDRDTGRSKGFGFVQMADDAAARKAIAELNGSTLGDRTLRVDEAQARPDRGSRGGGGGRW